MRLIFANQLRGIAALCVVVTHFLGVYWTMPKMVATATSTPFLNADQPAFIAPLWSLLGHVHFNPGPFGVALFFLLSGLVLPFSFKSHTPVTFATARLLRIYPAYMAAFVLQVLVVGVNAYCWQEPFNHSLPEIAANFFLVQDWFQQPNFDSVNWTLLIELKFYVLVAVLAPLIVKGSAGAILLSASALAAATTLDFLPQAIQANCPLLIFMLTGVLFNFRAEGLISRPVLAASTLFVSVLFVVSWKLSIYADRFSVFAPSYFYGLAVFSILFSWRNHIKKFAFLDWISAISYPLYLIHAMIGYSLFKFLMQWFELGFLLALTITLPIVLGLSALLHKTIELRSINMGRRLSSPQTASSPILLGPLATDDLVQKA